ncbi:hypothetical protein Acr_24g0008980 [Actinidia rufa]|uniref:Uncharacterized protein n=1 Tax=Actinidia rufa TaxID=165716 RepID=A0A7J0GVA7_9ERIC|nr:hypothetical protein Acr_24g0008980 [Actinidia rufa]
MKNSVSEQSLYIESEDEDEDEDEDVEKEFDKGEIDGYDSDFSNCSNENQKQSKPSSVNTTWPQSYRQVRRPSAFTELVALDLSRGCLSPNPLDRGKTSPTFSSEPRQVIYTELARATIRVLLRWSELKYCFFLAFGRVWRRLWERQFSMHLRSRNLPKPSASSPLDNRAPPMANASQVPDLEGLYHEIHGMAEQMRVMNENNARLIQLLAAANPQPPAAPFIPDVERSRHFNRSGDRSHNSNAIPNEKGEKPSQRGNTRARDKSTSQKIRDLDARLDAINTGTNAPITVDALVRQTNPPFTERVLRTRISSKFKLPTSSAFMKERQIQWITWTQTDKRMPPTCSPFTKKKTESLKDFVKRFNQAVLDVEDPSDKVIIMAMMEGLRPDRPPPHSPERKYGDNRPTAGNIQTIHGGFGSGGCSTSSRKRHARSAFRSIEEEVYNLSSPCASDQPPITFSSDDLRGLHLPHDDALVVSAVIANFNVQRILIDSGSSADILFISAFEKMKIGLDKLHPFHTPLIGFGGNTTHPLGWINLPITLGTEPQQTTVMAGFHRGETGDDDVETLRDEMEQLILEDPKQTENTKHLEEVTPISIHPNYPERQVMIGTELTDELRIALTDFLKKNSDVFAWSQGDVPGIDLEVAMHKLFTKPDCSPVHTPQPEATPLEAGISKEPTTEQNLAHWILYVDGSSNQHGCGAGLVLRAPSGEQMECIPLEFLTHPSIGVANQILQMEENSTWLDEIIDYLRKGILPKDKRQARRLQYRSARFCIFEGRLYKRSFSGPLLRCLRPEEAESSQANGQVEVTNPPQEFEGEVRKVKKRMGGRLAKLIWAYHTTSRIPTGETPYSLVFGTESVIPVEIGVPSFRTLNFNEKGNEGELRLNLDLLDEKRESSELRKRLTRSDRQILQ